MALPIESTFNRLAGLGHWMMTLAGHTLRAGPACGQQRRLLPGQKNQARNIMTPIMGARYGLAWKEKFVQVGATWGTGPASAGPTARASALASAK